jgi:hypothetical protein
MFSNKLGSIRKKTVVTQYRYYTIFALNDEKRSKKKKKKTFNIRCPNRDQNEYFPNEKQREPKKIRYIAKKEANMYHCSAELKSYEDI